MPLNKHLFTYLPCLFVFVFINLIISSTFLSPNTHAYNLSISASDISVDVISGKTSIKESEIEIISDCRAGYNFSISTSNNPSLYLNGNDSGSAVFNAVDGTNTLASSNNLNKWGYYYNSLSSDAPTETSIFSPLSTTETVLKTTLDTASPNSDIDDAFSIYYGVNASDSVAPGSYAMSDGNNTNSTNGIINYYATMDSSCMSYTVNFDANGGTGTMNNQSIPVSISTKLNSNEFTAPSIGSSYQNANGTTINGTAGKLWTFWGWNTNAAGTGDWYKDRESVQGLASANQTITLYAQWKQATLDDMLTATSGTKTITHSTMQDMSAAICFNSDITTKAALEAANKTGAVTLTDDRDGTTRSYDVSKLADGNCWMTTNLALGTTSEVILTSDDTDLDEGTTFTLPAGTTTSSTTNTAARIRLTNNNGTDANGVYYSWPAAVASTTSTSATPTISICPKNWDLPTNAQFTTLSSASSYSSSNSTTDLPSQFKIDGGFTNGATFYQTTYSHYWSATSYSTSAAWGARTDTSTLTTSRTTGTTYGGNKYYRKNIRCVASSGKVTIHYDKNNSSATGNMADQTNIEINAGAISSNAYTLTDHRFKNWNTAPNGNGTSVAAGATLSSLGLYDGQEITLYAQWNPVYYIAFNANESSVDGSITATGTMTNQTVVRDTATSIKTNTFALTGYIFRGWNTSADGSGTFYSNNQTVTNLTTTGNTITLYAQWNPVYYIAFNANESSVGGTAGSATGTMTNQTVVRDVATAIKSSTFALNGYVFYGWNTKADGTGTFYSDEHKVTNLTTTGNTITLYAVWSDGAYLDIGSYVNRKLKILAGNSSATYSTQDNTITALVRSNSLPNDFTPATENTISHSSSPYPIYAWYDSTNTTIYYYSEATNIIMNKNSGAFFYEMRALSNLSTISTWDTVKVTQMGDMFRYTGYNASSFVLDLSSWIVSSGATSTQTMFNYAGCNATTFALNLSSWDTSSLTSTSQMFYRAGFNSSSFTLNLSYWDTSSVTNMSSMFAEAGASATTWSVIGLSSWDTSSLTNLNGTFHSAGGNAATFTLDLSSWDVSNVKIMSLTFAGVGSSATTWSIGNLSSWDTSSVTDMNSMFAGAGHSATTWSIGDISSWDTSNVTSMDGMFSSAGYNASSFNLDLSSWDISNVKYLGRMFRDAGYSATTWSVGDLSSWNTSSVTQTTYMFSSAGYNAPSFTLNLSSWDTSNVTNMSYMFQNAGYNASSFTLNLSSWNTSSVTNMNNMFSSSGNSATTWSVTIPKTNNGTAIGPITNNTSRLYGNTTSVYATPRTGKSFTIAN